MQFFCVNGVQSVHLLYKIGRFSSIPFNESIVSIPTAPKLHQNRKGDSFSKFMPLLSYVPKIK